VKRHRRETTPSEFDKNQEAQKEKTTLQTTLKEKQIHSQETTRKGNSKVLQKRKYL